MLISVLFNDFSFYSTFIGHMIICCAFQFSKNPFLVNMQVLERLFQCAFDPCCHGDLTCCVSTCYKTYLPVCQTPIAKIHKFSSLSCLCSFIRFCQLGQVIKL